MLAAQDVWICRYCEQEVDRDAGVCHSCGTIFVARRDIVRLQQPAPDSPARCACCGEVIDGGAAVCHSCGSVLRPRG